MEIREFVKLAVVSRSSRTKYLTFGNRGPRLGLAPDPTALS